MVPTHEGGTKGYWSIGAFGEYQHFMFVNTILPSFLSSPGVFHSAKCTTTDIASSYDSYTWRTLTPGHRVNGQPAEGGWSFESNTLSCWPPRNATRLLITT